MGKELSNEEKQLKCYIYTRVSTSIQVDGYSLDAQCKLGQRFTVTGIKDYMKLLPPPSDEQRLVALVRRKGRGR